MTILISNTRLLKQPDGLAWHGGAVLYAAAAYATGIAGLFHVSWLVNIAATILLAHAMTWNSPAIPAAYAAAA